MGALHPNAATVAGVMCHLSRTFPPKTYRLAPELGPDGALISLTNTETGSTYRAAWGEGVSAETVVAAALAWKEAGEPSLEQTADEVEAL